ncbi:MAG: class I SAM-dependent methyltransferase [Chthoniobacterales bacterium]
MKASDIPGKPERSYIPAAGLHWLLPLFDLVTKPTGADRARSALPEQAELRPGQQVLDVGCGTGTLAILLKQQHPEIEVVGLDPDPRALALARRKAQRATVSVHFDRGFSDALEYPADSFDHVFSSFMFHHLQNNQKEETLREIRRVLKPGGYLHLLDFRGPESASGLLSLWFHSHHILKENSERRILTLMAKAGLADPRTVEYRTVLFGFGHVAYYQASALKLARAKTNQL